MSEINYDFRTYNWEPEPDPIIAKGDKVYGMTADGEPLTLYVQDVAEDGTIRIGADKPTD